MKSSGLQRQSLGADSGSKGKGLGARASTGGDRANANTEDIIMTAKASGGAKSSGLAAQMFEVLSAATNTSTIASEISASLLQASTFTSVPSGNDSQSSKDIIINMATYDLGMNEPSVRPSHLRSSVSSASAAVPLASSFVAAPLPSVINSQSSSSPYISSESAEKKQNINIALSPLHTAAGSLDARGATEHEYVKAALISADLLPVSSSLGIDSAASDRSASFSSPPENPHVIVSSPTRDKSVSLKTISVNQDARGGKTGHNEIEMEVRQVPTRTKSGPTFTTNPGDKIKVHGHEYAPVQHFPVSGFRYEMTARGRVEAVYLPSSPSNPLLPSCPDDSLVGYQMD